MRQLLGIRMFESADQMFKLFPGINVEGLDCGSGYRVRCHRRGLLVLGRMHKICLSCFTTQKRPLLQFIPNTNPLTHCFLEVWRRYKRAAPGVFDTELFTQQSTLFLVPVVLCRESYPRIDAVSGPGSCVYDGVMGQCDRMEYRRLYAALPTLWKVDPGRLRCGKHRGYLKTSS